MIFFLQSLDDILEQYLTVSREFHILKKCHNRGKNLILATIVDETIASELHRVKLRKHPFERGVFWDDRHDTREDTRCDAGRAGVAVRNEEIAS